MAATMAPAPRGKTNVHDVRITVVKDMYIVFSSQRTPSLFLLFSKHTHELSRLQKDPQSMCVADHHHHHTRDPTEV
jgi:hypothetical protein